jgi:hypothetical protein
MTLLSILVALVLAFLAFRFVKGLIKFAVLAVTALVCIIVAYQSGAF